MCSFMLCLLHLNILVIHHGVRVLHLLMLYLMHNYSSGEAKVYFSDDIVVQQFTWIFLFLFLFYFHLSKKRVILLIKFFFFLGWCCCTLLMLHIDCNKKSLSINVRHIWALIYKYTHTSVHYRLV